MTLHFYKDSGCTDIVTLIKYLILLLLICSSQVQACPVVNKHIQITANGHGLTAELAVNATSHLCGLAFRDNLPSDQGMLFVYPRDQILSFWMKNTYIPLSIAFLDDAGKILEIHDMNPAYPARRYTSKTPARYALEVNTGWFSDKGIKVDDRVEFDLQANP
jgi:uncharacterized membrane protein (UPF0127 family)